MQFTMNYGGKSYKMQTFRDDSGNRSIKVTKDYDRNDSQKGR